MASLDCLSSGLEGNICRIYCVMKRTAIFKEHLPWAATADQTHLNSKKFLL